MASLHYFALVVLSTFVLLTTETASQSPVVVCYLGSWAVYRPTHGKFDVENIDPNLCTHLVYAFAGLNATTNQMVSLDPIYDITNGGFARAVSLKKRNPRLKVLIAIGGWTEGSTKYSDMAGDMANVKVFINSVISFMREHKFDGLDLDWEYPANRGGKPEDKKNFVTLCQHLRNAFDNFGWLLTAAVGASKQTADTAYDLPALSRELDFLHLMAYDYHGKWDGRTGHNAPLYPRDDETENQRILNVEFSVEHYLKSGVPPSKLVLGVGFYGRTFILSDPSNPAIAAPSKSTAFAGPYTREDGFLGYNEICEKQLEEPGQWRVVWQKAHQAPYMFKDNMWVSYDDDNSISLKVAFAQSRSLAGVMIWSIDTDDFRGRCGAGPYPLLTAINKALGRTVQPSVPAPRPPTPGVPLPPSPAVPSPGVPQPGVPLPYPPKPVEPTTGHGKPLPPPLHVPGIDHGVEDDNTLDGSRTGFSNKPPSSDAPAFGSFQGFIIFALFVFAVQYLFKHNLTTSGTGVVPKKYVHQQDDGTEDSIPGLVEEKKDL